ncbi:Serine/threonine_protein phosphatase 5 [Hexamita inflata]|uniref:Serine/threonine protein phosphatase 5 n=1 Tax=Hexamita inflata TaxID=28002 RepID=A0AA86Q4M2_9EUKA|nr:Serine/threonine protein phosphatase 5 [Hexamita inflata]
MSMDLQQKIRLQAAQQGSAYKELSEFIKDQSKSDIKAGEAARNFDPNKVALPSIRGLNDQNQDAEFKKQLGNEQFKQKKFAAAMSTYQDIIDSFTDLAPEFKANIYFNMGLCHQKVKPADLFTLEQYFSMAITLQPNYEKARVKRAKVFMDQKKFEEALNDFKHSGRDQDNLQAEINTCIQEIQKSKPISNAIQFEDSDNENDAQIDEKQPEKQILSAQYEPKKEEKIEKIEIPVQKPLGYEANYSVPETNKNYHILLKIREFSKYPVNMGLFFNQLHSAVFSEFFEEYQKEISIQELETIVVGVLGCEAISSVKKLNVLHSLSQIKRLQMYYESFDEVTQADLKVLYEKLGNQSQLTDVQKVRLEQLQKVW